MHWVLQSNIYEEAAFQELKECLERLEISHSEHKVIPFIGQLEPDADFPEWDNVMCMGSYSMRHVAKQKNWIPGVFEVPGYQECLKQWGYNTMLNYDADFIEFVDLPKWLKHYCDPLFIRPESDAKYFAGKVMSQFELLEWYHKVVELEEDDGTSLRGSTRIMIAPPKKLLQEFRFWIVDNKVITSSMYKIGKRVIYKDESHTPAEMSLIAHWAAYPGRWQPSRAYVLDACYTENYECKIVEINCLNAAGLYAANIPKLIDTLDNMDYKEGL